MSQIKYLLDEHVSPALRTGLKARWPQIEVWCIGDPGAPARSTPDPDILLWCEQHQFILVTNNRASMPVHLADHLSEGRHVPGIFILGKRLSMKDTILDLAVTWGASDLQEYRDFISHLPLSL
jgi:hypothetical protein